METIRYPKGISDTFLKNELKSLKDNGFKFMAWYGKDKFFNIQRVV